MHELLSPRHGSNEWAFRDDVITAFKAGKQLEVPPMTLEFAPTLACDAACPGCPYGKPRKQLSRPLLPVRADAPDDDEHAASLTTALRVLGRAREAGVRGVLFTGGGEPLVWEHLSEALAYSRSLGMSNALYTNGFRLGLEDRLAQELMSPEHGLVFVRVSINATTRQAFRAHWGIAHLDSGAQFNALTRLFQARNDLAPAYDRTKHAVPSVQVSVIANHQNVGELANICQNLALVSQQHRRVAGPEDVVIVRPMTVHGRPGGYSCSDHSEEQVIRQIIRQCGPGSRAACLLSRSGLRLFLGFGLDAVARGESRSYEEVLHREYEQRDTSWANGIFLTVGPEGSVYPSTEYNCNRDWAIGNLRRQTVQEVYGSSRRAELLGRFNSAKWGPEVSQPTARASRLDRVARFALAGGLNSSVVDAIRRSAVRGHKLLLD
jgi:organic radical activating enzyme